MRLILRDSASHHTLSTAGLRIKGERLLVVPYGGIELPQAAIGIAEIVLNIGIAVIAQARGGERFDGSIPVAGRQGPVYRRRTPDQVPPNLRSQPMMPSTSKSATLRRGPVPRFRWPPSPPLALAGGVRSKCMPSVLRPRCRTALR